ncbi:hypothetical protein RB653_007336 [Dictyostelium firmibasis]|uniref:Uncharacterized protein n=1 Tax=Dictyostelium firmibasis TaxID=79012 RepID=A0AAN7U115_9MYCE
MIKLNGCYYKQKIGFIILVLLLFICSFVDCTTTILNRQPQQFSAQPTSQQQQKQPLPQLRFSKTIETPNGIAQLRCIGGTAMGTNEEVLYLLCKPSLLDIYSRDISWRCYTNSISKNVQLSKLRIDCPKPSSTLLTSFTLYGNDHPCSVTYELDWEHYSFTKVIGWSILGIFFFYILLNRNNHLYNAQINNPMSLPREQINPKVFRALGFIVCIIVFLSTLAFMALCLYMFSAPIQY